MSRFKWNIPLEKASWTIYNPLHKVDKYYYTLHRQNCDYISWRKDLLLGLEELGKLHSIFLARHQCVRRQHLLVDRCHNYICPFFIQIGFVKNTVRLIIQYIFWVRDRQEVPAHIYNFSLWILSQMSSLWKIILKLTVSYNGLLTALMLFHSHIKLMLLSMWLLNPLIYHP